jgi:hypothetical protein
MIGAESLAAIQVEESNVNSFFIRWLDAKS